MSAKGEQVPTTFAGAGIYPYAYPYPYLYPYASYMYYSYPFTHYQYWGYPYSYYPPLTVGATFAVGGHSHGGHY